MPGFRDASFFRRFVAWIRKEGLIPRGARLVVAFSGGKDSVALAHLLLRLRKRWSLDLSLAHFHHGLRGDADAQADFCVRWAKERGLPLHLGRTEGAPSAESPEHWARRVRYRFLQEVARERDALLVTAHTLSDALETFLLALLRGARTESLLLPPKRDRIIRPLLYAWEDEVLAYCLWHRLSWYEDPMNYDLRYPRNAVRRRVLPALLEVWEGRLRETFPRTLRRLQAEAALLRALRADGLPLDGPFLEGCLHHFLRRWSEVRLGAPLPENLATEVVDALLQDPRRPRQWNLPDGAILELRKGRLRVRRPAIPAPEGRSAHTTPDTGRSTHRPPARQ